VHAYLASVLLDIMCWFVMPVAPESAAVIEAPQVIAEAEAALNSSSSSSGAEAAAAPSSSGSKQINWYQQW
jgi:hypothetical protein